MANSTTSAGYVRVRWVILSRANHLKTPASADEGGVEHREAGVFTYCGLVVPVHAEGDAPVHVTWRILTLVPDELATPS